MTFEMDGNLLCSFCGKNQKEVRQLIAGPAVYICNECVALCSEIVGEQNQTDATVGEVKTIHDAIDRLNATSEKLNGIIKEANSLGKTLRAMAIEQVVKTED